MEPQNNAPAPGALTLSFLKNGFTSYFPAGQKRSLAVVAAASLAFGAIAFGGFMASPSGTRANLAPTTEISTASGPVSAAPQAAAFETAPSPLAASESPGYGTDERGGLDRPAPEAAAAPSEGPGEAPGEALKPAIAEAPPAPPPGPSGAAEVSAGQAAAEAMLLRSAQVSRSGDFEVATLPGGIDTLIREIERTDQARAAIQPHRQTPPRATSEVIVSNTDKDEADEVDLAAFEDYELQPRIIAALREAGVKTGMDPAMLMAVAWRESRFDPDAEDENSSARGLYGFTKVTWMRAIKLFGDRHGLGRYAAGIRDLDDGRMAIRPDIRDRVMKMRLDPHMAAVMAAEFWLMDREKLRDTIKREPKPIDVYMTHLLGLPSAKRFLTAVHERPGASSKAVVPVAVANNPGLFIRDGRVLTVGEAYRNMGNNLNDKLSRYAVLLKADIGRPASTRVRQDAATTVDTAPARFTPDATAPTVDARPLFAPLPGQKPTTAGTATPPTATTVAATTMAAAPAVVAPLPGMKPTPPTDKVSDKLAAKIAAKSTAKQNQEHTAEHIPQPDHKPRMRS